MEERLEDLKSEVEAGDGDDAEAFAGAGGGFFLGRKNELAPAGVFDGDEGSTGAIVFEAAVDGFFVAEAGHGSPKVEQKEWGNRRGLLGEDVEKRAWSRDGTGGAGAWPRKGKPARGQGAAGGFMKWALSRTKLMT